MSIQSLWVYPVKSCAGIEVSSAAYTKLGLLYDRHFMVCHATSGRLLSQRQLPRMALITVKLDDEVIAGTKPGHGTSLTLSAPDMPPLTVPLHPPAKLDPESITTCQVWEWKGPAFDVGKEASEWLTRFLGRPARLVRYLGTGQAPSQWYTFVVIRQLVYFMWINRRPSTSRFAGRTARNGCRMGSWCYDWLCRRLPTAADQHSISV